METENNNGNKKSNLNTILLWVTLAALAFIARQSWINSIDLATMKGAQITRQEVDSKMAEVKALILISEGRITQINLDFEKFKTEQVLSIRPKR